MAEFKDYETPYAMARIYGDNTYGHMELRARNLVGKDNWRDPTILVTAQIGGDPAHGQDRKLYDHKVGLEFPNDLAYTQSLQDGLALSKKLDKKLAQYTFELGPPECFADLCWRVVVALGVEWTFVNPNWGGGYYGDITTLPHFRMKTPGARVELRDSLRALERRICSQYAKQAA